MKLEKLITPVAAASLLLAGSSQAVIVYNNPGTLAGNEIVTAPLVLGMDFAVTAGGGGWVTAIGAFDNGLGGFSSTVHVGIYDVGSSTLVPGTAVDFSGTTGTLIGSSRFVTLGAPVFLAPGTYSIVAANYGALGSLEKNYNSAVAVSGTPPTFDSALGTLAIAGNRSTIGSSLVFPGGSIFSGPDVPFAAGTFDFTPVPEAETFGLAAVGLLGLVYFGRNLFLRSRTA